MNKNINILLCIAFLFVSATTIQNDKLFDISKNIEIFVNTYKHLSKDFVDEIDPSNLMSIGIEAMVGSLDPYTNYISENKIESYRLNDINKYQGLGAKIDIIENRATVIEIIENSPAHKSGLKVGDLLLQINGKSTIGKSKKEIDAITLGVQGSKMNLQISNWNKSKKKNITIQRYQSEVSNIAYSGIIKKNYGYIKLTTFTRNAYQNIKKNILKFKENGPLAGVILDLRDNGGGLLSEAVNICSIFLPKNSPVVTTKGKILENDKTYKTILPPIDTEIPLTILINSKSASASEIVAGVIQDLDRGIIIGQRSFGKGLVQQTRDLGYNSKLKLTISKYYIPSGRCIQATEYANGLPVDIPDENRSKFKTRNGRLVLDGGGVTPDHIMVKNKRSEVLQWLLEENIIFAYVNHFTENIDSLNSDSDYQYKDYQSFIEFFNTNKWRFTPSSANEINDLIENNKFTEKIKNSIIEIKKEIVDQHNNDINLYKNEISAEIEKEIISRYLYESGKTKHALDSDLEIQEAIRIMGNPAEYFKILN